MMHNISYDIIRSDRKTTAIQITTEGKVLVRCPKKRSKAEIDRIIADKSDWILSHLEKYRNAEAVSPYTQRQLNDLAEKAKAYLPGRVRFFANQMDLTYGRITVRCQRSRWGSCSSAGNLNFNCLLMLAPKEVIDYVIIHELCHRREMNHSPAFWAEVARYMPNYGTYRNWLKTEGSKLIRRIPK